jgi:hypothetical protein
MLNKAIVIKILKIAARGECKAHQLKKFAAETIKHYCNKF